MNIKHTSLRPILNLLKQEDGLTPKQISELSGLGKTIVHTYLGELVARGEIYKKGKTPRVRYFLSHISEELNPSSRVRDDIFLDYQTEEKLNQVFFKVSPTGKKYVGSDGMKDWCKERNLDFSQKYRLYLEISDYVQKIQDNCGLLDASLAFGKGFSEVALSKIYYADQYKYMEFGRGKLAELTFYGKQSQNLKLIGESMGIIFPKLRCLISREKYDALAITPWSMQRKNQILGILTSQLRMLNLPFIVFTKEYENGIIVPQKSLKTRQERIENAQNTIFVKERNLSQYKKVLLIDDFVGSGATLNETAKKLKIAGVQEVHGFAFVGNMDLSYEVIREI